MGAFIHTLRNIIEAMLTIVDTMPDWLGLTIVSVVSGVVMLLVFGLVTPPHWLKRSRELATAAMYEVRLYLDSPRRVLAAQARLIFWSFAYTAAMLPAFIVLTIPFGLLLVHMEQRYGIEQLPTDEPVLVRLQLSDDVTVEPQKSPNVKVTAPVLQDSVEKTAYVRVELDEPKSSTLKLKVGDDVVEKRLDADPESPVYSPTRADGMALFVVLTDEPPLDSPTVEKIKVNHPARDQDWVPFGMPWWLWWLLVSILAAGALAKPLNVQL
jgi:hypothetical protein